MANDNHVTIDPTQYRVYSLPPIVAVDRADAARHIAATVSLLEQMVSGEASIDAANVGARLRDLAVHIQRLGGLDRVLTDAYVILDLLTHFGPEDVQPLVDLIWALVTSIDVDEVLTSAGLPTLAEIAEDPTAVPPVGVGDVAAVVVEDESGVGSVLVLPTGTSVALVGAAWNDAMVQVTTVLSTTPVDPSLLEGQPDPTAGDKWRPAGGLRCMSRKQNDTAWYDPCSWWYEHMADGNDSRWTWGLVQYGTGKSKGIWKLKSLEVQSWRKAGTPDQDWIKWSPDSDMEAGHCSSITVGVNVKVAYLEVAKSMCDQWDISKGEQPADFANRWRSTYGAGRTERSTASVIATDTPNGYVPHDLLSFDYYAK